MHAKNNSTLLIHWFTKNFLTFCNFLVTYLITDTLLFQSLTFNSCKYEGHHKLPNYFISLDIFVMILIIVNTD